MTVNKPTISQKRRNKPEIKKNACFAPILSTLLKAFDCTKQIHIESIHNPDTYSIKLKGFDAYFIRNYFHYVKKRRQNHQFGPNLATWLMISYTIEMISNEKCISNFISVDPGYNFVHNLVHR